jgi:hypothetical protein
MKLNVHYPIGDKIKSLVTSNLHRGLSIEAKHIWYHNKISAKPLTINARNILNVSIAIKTNELRKELLYNK